MDTCAVPFPPNLRERAESAVRDDFPDTEQLTPDQIHELIYDLRVNQAERDLQIAELQKACDERSRQAEDSRNLLKSSPDVIARFDRNFNIRYANPAFERVTGISVERAIGHSLTDMKFQYVNVSIWETGILRVFETRAEAAVEFEYTGTEGRRYYHARIVPEQYENIRMVEVLFIAHDITDVVEKREELRENAERFRIISELISDYAYSYRVETDSRLTIEWVVGAFQDITGYTPEEANAKGDFIAIIHPDDKQQNLRRLEGLLSGHEERTRLRYISKDGAVHWMQDNARPITDDHGCVLHVVGATADISDLKHAEEELRKTLDELEEQVREATAEREINEKRVTELRTEREAFLRHEVKNLLTPLMLNTSALRMAEHLTEKQLRALENLEKSIKRTNSFITQLKNMTDLELGKYSLTKVNYPLDAIISQTVEELKPSAVQAGVNLIFVNNASNAVMPLDMNFLPGVFNNLIRNAIEHVELIEDTGQKTIAVELSRKQDQYVVRINNRGTPIPPDLLSTFFEKFNVGPEKPGGTGLGTTYALLVTKAHGGNIAVQSNVDEGTTVTLSFPVST